MQTFEGRANLWGMPENDENIREAHAAFENPCGEHTPSDAGVYAVFAGAALIQTLDGDTKGAEEWLRMIPRTRRGEVNIALEDLSMQLSRLGN